MHEHLDGASHAPPRAAPAAPGAADPGDEWTELGRRLRFLSRVELFRGLPRDQLTPIATALRPQSVAAGGLICREGEPADRFYLVDTGAVVVSTTIADRAHQLARLGPGQSFGEIALLGHSRRTATVRAEGPVQLWSLTATDFDEVRQRLPALDAAVRQIAQARRAADQQAVFEIESRNVAALAQGRQQIRIGRSPDNDLVFASRLVSRHHAVLERTDHGYRLRDLGSSNGTYVDGVRIAEADLADGAEIRMGDERFIFDRREIRRVVEPRGMRVDAIHLIKQIRGGRTLLNDISLSIQPGELVAIVGASGAGKTTLLDALSGVRPATGGSVLYNGQDYYRNLQMYRSSLGYVPQDDIIHRDLAVKRTLWYAGKLRLTADASQPELEVAINEVLRGLDLTAQADLRVASLSGGQRKRASIGVELLTRPRIFFLDEPTSGLDPATDAQMMHLLRRLADQGSTIVLTTHATRNVAVCDTVVFLARGGYLTFAGTPQAALEYFEVEAIEQIYQRLNEEATPAEWTQRFRTSAYCPPLSDAPPVAAARPPAAKRGAAPRAGRGLTDGVRQWALLSRRNLEILIQAPAKLATLVVLPIAITVLLTIYARAQAFSPDVPNPMTPTQILFFLTFGAFFFGVTYGLEEICKEFAIFFRERMVGLGIVPYVLAKVAILLPLLIILTAMMLGLLRATDRLPNSGLDIYSPLAITVFLTALVGLTLGLLASAAVRTPEQASIILPGLILPQVLFSGAFLPVPAMGDVARFLSYFMAIRWSFEAMGHIVDLNGLYANGRSSLGPPLLQQYGDTFSRNHTENWAILGGMALLFLTLTCVTLKRKHGGG